MAVLTFPGADAVLAVQSATLPQPDQLCGPFAAHAALHSVLDASEVPSLADIARASGSAIWPHDMAAWRPAGAPLDRRGWDELPTASGPGASGTNAAGLADGIVAVTDGAVAVVPVAGRSTDPDQLLGLVTAVAQAAEPVGVLANVWTGALDPGTAWEVGHFVLLWAVDPDGPGGPTVAVADTYRELGAPGERPGCRWVNVERLAAAVAAPPGRGLLLVTSAAAAPAVMGTINTAGLAPTIWST